MARKHHTAEQIIGKLRQAEVVLGQGGDLEKALREIGVTKTRIAVALSSPLISAHYLRLKTPFDRAAAGVLTFVALGLIARSLSAP